MVNILSCCIRRYVMLQLSSLTVSGRGCSHCGCLSTSMHSTLTASQHWNVCTTSGTSSSPRYITSLHVPLTF